MSPKAPHVKRFDLQGGATEKCRELAGSVCVPRTPELSSSLLSLLLPGQWVSLALSLATAEMYYLARGQGNGINQPAAGTFQTVSSNKPFVSVS